MAAEGREGFGQGGTHGTASGAAERCWGRQMHVGFSVMGKRCGAFCGYKCLAFCLTAPVTQHSDMFDNSTAYV